MVKYKATRFTVVCEVAAATAQAVINRQPLPPPQGNADQVAYTPLTM